jgi:hypothetical protein
MRTFFIAFAALCLSANALAHDMSAHWKALHQKRGGLALSVSAEPSDHSASSGALWRVEAREGHLWVSQAADSRSAFSTPTKVNSVAETIQAEGQNRPQIDVTMVDGKPIVLVAWSQALDKVFAGRVRFSRSLDGGKSFEPPRTINDDPSDIADTYGHSFVALDATTNGRLTLAWIDSRAAHLARQQAGGKRDAYNGSSIYIANSSDGGASFSPNHKLADHSCECCKLGLARESDGSPVLLWRHLFANDERDFAIARLPKAMSQTHIERASDDHWAINACPHHGGDLAITREGTRHWVWFTGSPQNPGLFYRSQHGETRTDAQAFGSLDTQSGFPAIWASAGGAQLVRIWRDFADKHYRLQSQRSQDGGITWDAPRTLARSAGAADQPQFVRHARIPLIAWNTTDEGLRLIDAHAQP